MAEGPVDDEQDPMARLSDRAQEYASIWRSAIERNASGAYKPEDWFDDVNRTFVMAAEDAARAFAAVVDAMASRTADSDEGDDEGDDEAEDGPSATG